MTTHELARVEQAARRALFRKELREERAAIIAGAVVFLGLPALWTALYAVCAPRDNVFSGVATGLLLIGGWLFGAVVAAQSVCRDFGRPQGAFLLARPVLPGDVVRAKAKAGFIVVGSVALAVGLWELLLSSLARNPIDQQPWWGWWLAAAAGSLLAFWIAFAAAAITRQMLSGVMVAGLALVLLIVVPSVTTFPIRVLLWSLGQITDASWMYQGSAVRTLVVPSILSIIVVFGLLRMILPPARRPSILWFLGGIGLLLWAAAAVEDLNELRLWALLIVPPVGIAAFLAYGVARRACRSQHALRLGTKSVAWTIGLTMILLGTLAMTQAGANMRVTATYWNPRAAYSYPLVATPNERRSALGRAHIAEGSLSFAVALYDIGTNGVVRRHPPHLSIGEGAATIDRGLAGPIPAFDEHDRAFVVASMQPMQDRGNGYVDGGEVWVELREINLDEDTLGPVVQLPLPSEVSVDAKPVVYDAAIDGDHLFLLYQYDLRQERHTHVPHVVLAAYLRDQGTTPIPERSVALPGWPPLGPREEGWRLVRGVDDGLYALNGCLCPIRLSNSNAIQPDNRAITWEQTELTWGRRPVPLGPRTLAVSNRTGLIIMEVREPPKPNGLVPTLRAHVVGEVRASPWAWLFRADYPILVAAGPGRVWEVHDTSAICYDVSDPAHPRRIAHVTSYPIENAVAGPDFLLLDHGAGFSLVRNPP